MTDNGPQPVRERIIDINFGLLEEYLRGKVCQDDVDNVGALPKDLTIVRVATPHGRMISLTVTSKDFPAACPHQTRERAEVVVEEGG